MTEGNNYSTYRRLSDLLTLQLPVSKDGPDERLATGRRPHVWTVGRQIGRCFDTDIMEGLACFGDVRAASVSRHVESEFVR